MGLQLGELELFRHGYSLRPELDGLIVLFGQSVVARQLAQDTGLGPRRREIGRELPRAVEMLARAVALAPVPPHLGQERVGLGGAFVIAGRHQCLPGLLECPLSPLVAGEVPSLCELQEKTGSSGVGFRPELEGVLVIPRGGGVRVEGVGPVSRISEGTSRGVGKLAVVEAGGTRVVDCSHVVMREHLGVILGTAERIDPLRGTTVFVGAGGARDLPVGDVAYQQVPEGVFLVVLDRRPPFASNEVLALEGMERVANFP